MAEFGYDKFTRSMESAIGILDNLGRAVRGRSYDFAGLQVKLTKAEEDFTRLTNSANKSYAAMATAFIGTATGVGKFSESIRKSRIDVLNLQNAMESADRSAHMLKVAMDFNLVASRHMAAGLAGLTQELRGFTEGVGKFGGAISNALSTPTQKMGGYREALLSYNKLLYAVTRQASVLGQDTGLLKNTSNFWKEVEKNTALWPSQVLSVFAAPDTWRGFAYPHQSGLQPLPT